MNIHEYQGKSILSSFGVATQRGVVVDTVEEATAKAKQLAEETGTGWHVIKAQVHAGGRGKGGGVKLAKKHRLPQVLIDFIHTHHGTTRVEYFFRNHQKENPDKEFDESLFKYPGPRPKSKEETILMLADSLEAASKSLQNPTGRDIADLVEKLTSFKIEQRQLEESEITFEELEKCKLVFKLLLRSINHVRVEYPEE